MSKKSEYGYSGQGYSKLSFPF